MARLQPFRRREQVEGAVMEPRSGTGGAVAVLVFVVAVVAVAAVGEVVARRAPATRDAPRSSSWQPVMRIGDDARARGDLGAARRAYLTVLFRARGERSLLGLLSAAEGFQALGDREVVEHALRMAAALSPDAGNKAGRRLQTLRDRLDATDALPMAVHLPR
jgi:hypothetical protein